MTGEVTLTGKVLPVGGLKEKSLAALRAGIKTILVPDKNQKELAEVPARVRRRLQIIPVSHVDQVLDLALTAKPWKPYQPPHRKKAKAKAAKPGGEAPKPAAGRKKAKP